eukprot:123642-Pyramimonas_sp.AAC.1
MSTPVTIPMRVRMTIMNAVNCMPPPCDSLPPAEQVGSTTVPSAVCAAANSSSVANTWLASSVPKPAIFLLTIP